jgi:hypothetical protein
MIYIHTISIYELLGHDMFAMMMKSIFEQEVGENSIEDFLLMLSCEAKNDRMPRHKQNNRDKRHWLQKLVDNGKHLDHADEAKLNKLVAAHQKKTDQRHERE